MKKAKIFDFLERLNANNEKAWMDEHRAEYHSVKARLMEEVDALLVRLTAYDPEITTKEGRKALNKINNNKVFKPDAPTYKDHFGFGIGKGKSYADFYVHLGINETFMAGGFYSPSNDVLKKIREEIDYNQEEFTEIIQNAEFKNWFGGLMEDAKLTRPPKGYSEEHPLIDYLKLKRFAVWHSITKDDFLKDDFIDYAEKCYKVMRPFLGFLNRAIDA